MLAFSLNSISQNYISTKTSTTPGNIYHTGGNLGIGTTTPSKGLHIFEDYPNSAGIRLQTDYTEINTCNWDIENTKTTLKFNFSFGEGINTIKTRFSIDSLGRIVVNSLNSTGAVTNVSAILDLQSTTMGFLTPRMTNMQIEAITNPAQGLLVYSTDENNFRYYEDASWQTIPNSSSINSQLSNYLLIDDFNNHPTSQVTQQNINDWNTAYIWGNHADNGYITASSTEELTNKSGNISMWTNDVGYITDADIPTQFWQQTTNGITYNNGNVGIGTDIPEKQLHIVTQNANSTIRLTNIISNKGTNPPNPVVSSFWDIKNDNGKLVFSQGANPATTISAGGTITAQKFIGDGSQLTNLPLPETIWQQNDDVAFYNDGDVGIGTNQPLSQLHIKSGDPDIMLDVNSSKGYYSQLKFAEDGITKASLFYNTSSNSIILKNGDIEALKINPNGNIDLSNTADVNFTQYNGIGRYNSSKPFADYSEDLGVVLYGNPGGVLGGYYNVNGNYVQRSVMRWKWSNVYFGTPDYSVTVNVNGTVNAQKFYALNQSFWPDYVFQSNYDLMPLDSLQDYVQTNNHLPNVPSEQEILENGVDLANMQAIQMQKIEELTLYILELNATINQQQQEIDELKKTVNE